MDGVEFEKRVGKRPRVEVDVAYYQDMIDDPALSDEQKKQIIEALWSIVFAFAELGYGVHPVQAAKTCGNPAQSHENPTDSSQDDVVYPSNPKSKKNASVDHEDDPPTSEGV